MLGHLLLGWRAPLELIIHFSPGIFILFIIMTSFLIRLALVNLGEEWHSGWLGPCEQPASSHLGGKGNCPRP